MMTLQEYLKAPCSAFSIPYWKAKRIQIPENMQIIHDKAFVAAFYTDYEDEEYFRLSADLRNNAPVKVDGFTIKTAALEDLPLMASIINRSYTDLQVSEQQLIGYTRTPVYAPDLWLLIREESTGNYVGCGIADLDREAGELILEWIQILPEYRGRKLGQMLVTGLLEQGKNRASFATVSGKCDNPTNPERLYRKCGFSGDDVWHILRKR